MPHVKVTRQHREAAVAAMYPDCKPGSHMWHDFVERGDEATYRTPARVAQALADASLSPTEALRASVNAAAMTWLRIHGHRLFKHFADTENVDADDALRSVIQLDAETSEAEGRAEEIDVR